jgi:hypothetical protein
VERLDEAGEGNLVAGGGERDEGYDGRVDGPSRLDLRGGRSLTATGRPAGAKMRGTANELGRAPATTRPPPTSAVTRSLARTHAWRGSDARALSLGADRPESAARATEPFSLFRATSSTAVIPLSAPNMRAGSHVSAPR